MNHVEHDFDPTKFDFPPPLTRKQGLARWAADHELQQKYPLQYVAYIDVWNGEELDRRILWTASTLEESFALRQNLDPAIRGNVNVRWIGDPNEVFVPATFIDE